MRALSFSLRFLDFRVLFVRVVFQKIIREILHHTWKILKYFDCENFTKTFGESLSFVMRRFENYHLRELFGESLSFSRELKMCRGTLLFTRIFRKFTKLLCRLLLLAKILKIFCKKGIFIVLGRFQDI